MLQNIQIHIFCEERIRYLRSSKYNTLKLFYTVLLNRYCVKLKAFISQVAIYNVNSHKNEMTLDLIWV